ncbi:MAG: tetrahydromethanopterin S-methyltransferase subunit F [Methanotrichaceae archaeon]
MADEDIKTEEVTEEAAEEIAEEVSEELPITADIPYGRGLPTVVMPFMPPFDEIAESVTYKAQLVARDQKLGSGVDAAMPIGVVIGLLFAILMIFVPVLITT